MSAFVDTSVVLRYLTGEPPVLDEAARIIEADDALLVSDVVLLEAAYVLASVYRVPRAEIIDHLIALVQRPNIGTFGFDKALVVEGLLLCRPSRRVSIGGAMIWAAARSAGDGVVYSFDRRFPSSGIEVRQSRR